MLRSILLAMLASAAVAQPGHFNLRVDAGDGHGHVLKRFAYGDDGCGGDNVSPAIHWSGAPAGTRSFALTVHDPDAPHAGGWWHWLVVDLPAPTTDLAEGAPLPGKARSTRNDFGTQGWGGPCPPAGDPPHHYVFTLYALDVASLDVDANAAPARVASAIAAHALGRATVTLTYAR